MLASAGYFGRACQPTEMALAIVAGAIALAFQHIDKIQRFKGAGFEAEMRERLDSIVEAQTEPPPEDAAVAAESVEPDLDPATQSVLRALADPRFTWRYSGGLAEDTGIPRNRVQKILDALSEQGMAVFGRGRNGSIWALSSDGRRLLRARPRESAGAG